MGESYGRMGYVLENSPYLKTSTTLCHSREKTVNTSPFGTPLIDTKYQQEL
jgi:hypothetical protein